jgi:predicted DNA-binding protein (MmcQ/YjbR family)
LPAVDFRCSGRLGKSEIDKRKSEIDMNVDSIRAYCLAFPRATENLQWGEDLCFKVGGKIFVTLGIDSLRLCFKCTPDMFAELVELEDIGPAPYVGRYKWVMLDRLDALADAELKDLIAKSYEMVAAKAPKEGRKLRVRAARKKPRRKVGA